MLVANLIATPRSAHAVCRIVEPAGESGGVHFDPTTMVLYVLAPNQLVGHRCDAVDAGPTDSGVVTDAAVDASMIDPIPVLDLDAGDDDAGAVTPPTPTAPAEPPTMSMPIDPVDAGTTDPNARCPAGTFEAPVRGSVVHMVVQPSVLSTGGRAGLVMPVPARPDIHAANLDIFAALGMRLQPRIEIEREEVEDPSLGEQCRDFGGGCGDDGDDSFDDFDPGPTGSRDGGFYDPSTEGGELQEITFNEGVVNVENALSRPDYDVTVLNASSADALNAWMDQNGFEHDAQDDAAFAAYVAEGAWFVALEVHPAGERALAPLVVSFRSDEIPLLHRLQYDRAGGELVTEAFVMAQNRMTPADFSAETLYAAPAGFGGAATGFGLAEGWLTQLRFVRNTDEWMTDSALIAAANFEQRPTLTRREIVHVPVSTCSDSGGCSGGDDHGDHDDDGCLCSTRPLGSDRFGSTLGPSLLACLWLAWRNRRTRAPRS